MPLDADNMSIEPRGYDGEGAPCYDDDLLDLRWSTYLADAKVVAHGNHHDLEVGVMALIYSQDVDLIRKGVEIIGLLAEREIQRMDHPGLLDEESGRAWHHGRVVEDLRAKPQRYAEIADRAGWPDDPAALTDEQLDAATMIVLHPEWIDQILQKRPEGPSE